MKPIDVIKELTAGNGSPDGQKEIIRQVWEADCDDFFMGLDLATNPKYEYGLDAVPLIEEEDDGDPGTLTFAYFHKVCLNLAAGTLTPTQVQTVLEDCALKANISEWNLWYRRILLRTLHKHLPMDVIKQALLSLTKE